MNQKLKTYPDIIDYIAENITKTDYFKMFGKNTIIKSGKGWKSMFGRYDNRFGVMDYKLGMSILRLLDYFDGYLHSIDQQPIREPIRDIVNGKHGMIEMTNFENSLKMRESDENPEENENIGGKRNKNKTKRYNNARRRISRKMQSHRRLSRRI